jgi:hypothetical protein
MEFLELIKEIDKKYYEENKLSILAKVEDVPEPIVNALFQIKNKIPQKTKALVDFMSDLNFQEWDETKINTIAGLIADYEPDVEDERFLLIDFISYLQVSFYDTEAL